MGEWIKVLDKEPEYGKQILLYDKGNGFRIAVFECNNNGNTDIIISGDYPESLSYILGVNSYWTNLPEPPKGE